MAILKTANLQIDTDKPISDGKVSSKFFKWGEALWLPSWAMFATPSDEQIKNIVDLSIRLDSIRQLLNVPMRVSCWLRPVVPGKGDYNALIGGARESWHKVGGAVDIVPIGVSVDTAQSRIVPKLESLGLRMEQNGSKVGRNWVHLDNKPLPSGGNRFFIP